MLGELLAVISGDGMHHMLVGRQAFNDLCYPRSKKSRNEGKIKIPEPCNALNVSHIRAMEMFRELGETFKLSFDNKLNTSSQQRIQPTGADDTDTKVFSILVCF